MAVEVVVEAFGPGLDAAFVDVIDRLKSRDRLAPVTVVVPANSVGVAARRVLAAHGGGIAGVQFVTPFRLAELLAGARLAAEGRRPISNPVLGAAVRRALRETKGRFHAVGDHPATERAIASAFRELDVLDADELVRLAASGARARDVVALCRATRGRLDGFHTERDLVDAATTLVREHGLPAGFGAVVVYQPERVARPAIELFRSIAAGAPVVAVVGLVDDPELDAPTFELLDALEATIDAASVAAATRAFDASIDQIVSVSDPDDEARHIVRRVLAAARRGVPLERIAIVFANRDPYARLLHEHLAAAGIAHNGVAVRTLADSVAGRTLTAAFALGDHDLRRHDVLAFVATAPVRADGRPVDVASWERCSRQAGVIAGADQWNERLDRLARAHPDRERLVRACSELAAFIREVDGRLRRAKAATSWRELANIAAEVLRRHLPGDRAREGWPVEEQRAFERVQLAIDRLAHLDAIEPEPDLDAFRRALNAELDADLGRIGRIGEGVLLGPLDLAVGVRTDAVFVAGLAEGSFPSRRNDDSVLPDADRAVVGTDVLADRRRAARAEHRKLLSILAMASGERVLFHPRGDLRRTTDRPLSRYALDAVEAIAGTRPDGRELLTLDEKWLDVVPSFAAGVARARFPATAQDVRLRALTHDRPDREAFRRHAVVVADRALASAAELLHARGSARFTRFDGNLSECAIPDLTAAERPLSATRLEQYSVNPFGWFLTNLLGVGVIEAPDAIERMVPLDKGSLFHEILERFIAEHLERGSRKPPDEPWSADDRRRLHEIADEIGREYESKGLTGRAIHWRQDRRRLARDLDQFLLRDDLHRRDHRCTPIAAEFAFGPRGSLPAAPFELRDGRVLHLAGSADRLDAVEGGGYWVIDYKTGKSDGFENLDESNPDEQGTKLQLPIYAHATRHLIATPDAPVTAAYRFLTADGGYRDVRVPLTAGVADRVEYVIRSVCDLILAGLFPNPAQPPDSWGRLFPSVTDPDGRAQAEQARAWTAKSEDPALDPFWAVFEADPVEEVEVE
jgi:ATP-dependent helicase/nuclease subunit B